MSGAVDNQSTPKGKKGKKNKARRQSQAVNQV